MHCAKRANTIRIQLKGPLTVYEVVIPLQILSLKCLVIKMKSLKTEAEDSSSCRPQREEECSSCLSVVPDYYII